MSDDFEELQPVPGMTQDEIEGLRQYNAMMRGELPAEGEAGEQGDGGDPDGTEAGAAEHVGLAGEPAAAADEGEQAGDGDAVQAGHQPEQAPAQQKSVPAPADQQQASDDYLPAIPNIDVAALQARRAAIDEEIAALAEKADGAEISMADFMRQQSALNRELSGIERQIDRHALAVESRNDAIARSQRQMDAAWTSFMQSDGGKAFADDPLLGQMLGAKITAMAGEGRVFGRNMTDVVAEAADSVRSSMARALGRAPKQQQQQPPKAPQRAPAPGGNKTIASLPAAAPNTDMQGPLSGLEGKSDTEIAEAMRNMSPEQRERLLEAALGG